MRLRVKRDILILLRKLKHIVKKVGNDSNSRISPEIRSLATFWEGWAGKRPLLFSAFSSKRGLEGSRMTDKDLRRLSRSELLEMLIAQTEENRQLKIRLERAEAQLRDRRIAVEKAGSLAEAALQLNRVFEAADKAAQQYLENVRLMSEKGSGEL